jgi:hypothetical protein
MVVTDEEQYTGLLQQQIVKISDFDEFCLTINNIISSNHAKTVNFIQNGVVLQMMIEPVHVTFCYTVPGALEMAWFFATTNSSWPTDIYSIASPRPDGPQWLLVLQKSDAHPIDNAVHPDHRETDKLVQVSFLARSRIWTRCRLLLSRDVQHYPYSYHRFTDSKPESLWIPTAFFVSTVVLLCAAVALFVQNTFIVSREMMTVNRGPEHQLILTRKNVSEWVQHNYAEANWTLRLDDQTIVPAGLMDDDELKYQQWFEDRYPEKRTVARSKLYLDAGFLGDPYSVQMPTDWSFHNAHCLLSLRRYWKAKETGKHVCMKDVDPDHIKHCLDKMDRYVFFPGPFGSLPEQPITEPVMIWKTKVCY